MPYVKAILVATIAVAIAPVAALANPAAQGSRVVRSIEISEPSTILGTLLGGAAAILLRCKLTKREEVDIYKTKSYTKCNN